MGKPVDITARVLIDNHYRDWVRMLEGSDPPSVRKLDTSQAALSVEPDEAFEITRADETSYILHIEMQASYDPDMALRMLVYAVMLYRAPIANRYAAY